MKPVASFKRGLAKVQREWRARRYDRALVELDELLQDWPENPQLLIMRGQLIQLQEGSEGPSLEQAKAALKRAADLDQESPVALLELGHYLFAVEDNAEAAEKCFSKAIASCRQLLLEALLAKAKVLTELERRSDALACLAEAYWLQPRNGRSARETGGKELLDLFESLGRAE